MIDDNTDQRVIEDVRTAARVLPPGSRLPSVRELMARHRASPVTVQRAIARLAQEGLVVPRPGRGTFVAERHTAPGAEDPPDLSWQAVALGAPRGDGANLSALLELPPPGAIPLSTGYLDPALQPLAAIGAALGRAARRPAAWDRGPVEGREELRAWFARAAGGGFGAHDMVVCPGGQSALATACRALAAPGEPILVEAPTYVGALAAARMAQLRVIPVPTDAEGVRPALLAEAFERSGARLLYLQPTYANPHGATLSPGRRAAVLDIVAAAGAFVIEDDWGRDLAIDAEAPPALAAADRHGHVVYIRSLSKPAAPGLRVAAIGARGAAGERLRLARVIDDFFVSGPLQEAAVELVASPAWRRHLRALRGALRERRDALAAAIERGLPGMRLTLLPAGGLHLWFALPEGADDTAIAQRAEAGGVTVSSGRRWFAAEPPGPHLRLTFAGADPARLAEGARRLAAAAPELSG
jgi:DNA-binding transcriptional MocR family regulator